MNIHKNARLTPLGRAELACQVLEGGQSIAQAAQAFRVTAKTARKWTERFRQAGAEGLADRSSRPRRMRRPTPQAVIADIFALRRQRFTGKHIAKVVGVSAATVSCVLNRAGPELPARHRASDELPLWMHRYNSHRPHGRIKYQTPISHLGLSEDNLLRLHS